MAYSIWLQFDDRSSTFLRDEISNLSDELGGPIFEPHMTLIGDVNLPIETVMIFAKEFANCAIPAELNVERVSAGEKYFMALYLLVQIPQKLARTRIRLFQEMNPSNYTLDESHVSLAYGNHGDKISPQVLSRIEQKYVGTYLEAEYISVVQSSKSTPVNEWKTIVQLEFGMERSF